LIVLMIRGAAVVSAAAVASVFAGGAPADSTPIGMLPAGPTATLVTSKGELVSLALPTRSASVWRIARPLDSKFVRQIGEGNVGKNVVLVFKTYASGTTKISVARTRSDTSSVALESKVLTVRIR
jgi:hypothetical protein